MMQQLRSNRRNGGCCARRLQRLMACWSLGLMLLAGIAAPARAADWLGDTPLRGTFSTASVGWSGFYVGGTYGIGNPSVDFGNSSHDMVAYMLRDTALESQEHPEDWTALGTAVGHWTSYGGFVGFNVPWDGGLVLSGELGYNYLSGNGTSASDSMTRIVTPTTGTDTVTISTASSMRLKDYATVRARAGYDLGRFLPYAYLGLAVGRFDYSTTVALTVSGADNYAGTETNGKTNAITAGVDAGLGIDVGLTSNIFLRGEWEYMAYAPLSGIRYTANAFRGGLGVKF